MSLYMGRCPHCASSDANFPSVSATFVLHHPEHGHAVILPIISCIIDGTVEYDKSSPPFASFVSLVCPSSEVLKISK